MKLIVAQPVQKEAVVALDVSSATPDEIAEFVGAQKFNNSDGEMFVTYARNGIGLISKLKANDVIVKRGEQVLEILEDHIFKSRYICF